MTYTYFCDMLCKYWVENKRLGVRTVLLQGGMGEMSAEEVVDAMRNAFEEAERAAAPKKGGKKKATLAATEDAHVKNLAAAKKLTPDIVAKTDLVAVWIPVRSTRDCPGNPVQAWLNQANSLVLSAAGIKWNDVRKVQDSQGGIVYAQGVNCTQLVQGWVRDYIDLAVRTKNGVGDMLLAMDHRHKASEAVWGQVLQGIKFSMKNYQSVKEWKYTYGLRQIIVPVKVDDEMTEQEMEDAYEKNSAYVYKKMTEVFKNKTATSLKAAAREQNELLQQGQQPLGTPPLTALGGAPPGRPGAADGNGAAAVGAADGGTGGATPLAAPHPTAGGAARDAAGGNGGQPLGYLRAAPIVGTPEPTALGRAPAGQPGAADGSNGAAAGGDVAAGDDNAAASGVTGGGGLNGDGGDGFDGGAGFNGNGGAGFNGNGGAGFDGGAGFNGNGGAGFNGNGGAGFDGGAGFNGNGFNGNGGASFNGGGGAGFNGNGGAGFNGGGGAGFNGGGGVPGDGGPGGGVPGNGADVNPAGALVADLEHDRARREQERAWALAEHREQRGEELSTDGVHVVGDGYKEALVLARGHDLEAEARAHAALGGLYARVWKMADVGLVHYKRVLELAVALMPRVVSDTPWYREARDAVLKAQQAQTQVEEAAAAAAAQPHLDALRPQLEALSKAAEKGAHELLKLVYAQHPLPGAQPSQLPAEALRGDRLRETLRRAVVAYHPDRQLGHPMRWQVLSGEICKELSAKYQILK
ncbi:hypothetical protein HYH03_001211 [Edaphochlamys debaryana]|uniref:J domain-containing protein n=1 Tax=Edaphochlamys debaryana TaxID=47281 RepID=A0A835YHR0_9CHLO|nr:hypothetical protein HYH03_001211 [Edaphochlamys debaryana]|eukprot:KAG2501428.1 hypothetical protein HYH03_001211 [Edaphochlamys debaryana]